MKNHFALHRHMEFIAMPQQPNWFVAFPVEPGEWYYRLTKLFPQGTRLFGPTDLHLTVAFLGRLRQEAAQDVAQEVASMEPLCFEERLGTLIPLPSTRRLTAISLALAPASHQLLRWIETARPRFYELAAAAPDKRKVLPHITIARPPRPIDSGQKTALLEVIANTPPLLEKIVLQGPALYTWSQHRPRIQFEIVAAASSPRKS